ncbi:MAG: hypothetical protein HRU03_01865 [Nanoarchaeales archaeon]|nr:hypothetical protein [Nanoarchaeales archaeon]
MNSKINKSNQISADKLRKSITKLSIYVGAFMIVITLFIKNTKFEDYGWEIMSVLIFVWLIPFLKMSKKISELEKK